MTAMRVAGPSAVSAIDVDEAGWLTENRRLFTEAWWFEALWTERLPSPEVTALWARPREMRLVRYPCPKGAYPSLTRFLPAADWFERAARDRTGIVPAGHVDARPFLYHETYPAGHVHGGALPAYGPARSPEYPFIHHEGSGVFELPVGPIHAGVIEPGHFRFTTAGEIVLDLELRLNYTHKGTLELAVGRSAEHALRLVERLSGDNAASHALAFACACEAAARIDVPEPVQVSRTALVEMERVYNHLGDLAGIAVDVAFAAAASQFQALREEMMRWNQRLFGHRLLMNSVAVGGLHVAPDADAWRAFQADLPRVRKAFELAVEMAFSNSGLKERIEGTGHLSRANAELLACVGPAARASGVARDARADAPCLAYPRLAVSVVTRPEGTVDARSWVRIDEARWSLDALAGPLAEIAARGDEPAETRASGEGVAFVEASRGAVLSIVRLADGRVEHVHQRDPSFLNWRALEQAVLRNIVPDFPLINKSFNLSYSGSDA